VLPLLLVGSLIVVAYRGYLRLGDRFGALQRLYDFSRALSSADLDQAGTGAAVLEHVRSVMRARRADLVLLEHSGQLRRLSLDRNELSAVETREDDPTSIVSRSIAERKPVLRARPPGMFGRLVEYDSLLGDFTQVVVAPLVSSDRVLGALVACDRDEELDPFDTDDLLLFEALAGHATSNLERSRLVEELRHEAESKSHQATHDLLTGLPNRALFLTRAADLLATTGRIAVALLDLDRFKDVNDTLGHEMGDRLLCEIAERLVHAASGRAAVARLGGDEFALVVSDITGPEEAVGIVRDLDAALSRPVRIDGLTLAVTASAGLALAPDHGDNVAVLLQRADIAMYLAKERRSDVEVYSATRDESMQRRLMLGGQLVQALEAGDQLSLMYQPIARLNGGEIVRVEALARWLHPALGWIPATEFIGLAEQMGLIGEITEFVFGEACAQAGHWRHLGLNLGLAVNLSGRLLSDPGLVERVAQHLANHELPARLLTVELTETEVMADLGEASGVLNEFSKLGVRIAVDDYGTGYSSLAYLHRLPVQELKIDRSFVTNIADDPSNSIIVRSSITMAHSLGLSVVAEGAEDEATCAILADAGCDSVQGYYLSRPRKAADLETWLLDGASLQFSREVPPMRPLRVVGSTHDQGTTSGGARRTGA
ncbi:MAG: putative bifunctional diguanylate cyclase/phosphodiesterase, partial [Acidimicrobiales bacterium]